MLRLGGENGAGHYVKMVHNGIEYGDMQLICEAITCSRRRSIEAPMNPGIRRMEQGKLDNYLIEITADIFAKKDEDGIPMVDKILDTAGQREPVSGRESAR